MTPRSIRDPPDEQDSISRPGWAALQLLDEPVERQRLGVYAGCATAGLVTGIDEVPVVVPLDGGDVVFLEQRQHLIAHMGVRPRGWRG